MSYSITVKDLSKAFDGKTVLDRIHLGISKGEIFGLIGPSGAGKTTLIRILTGQYLQDQGTAAINGIDTRELSGDDRKRFGITMDDFGVYERLSCYDNLKIFAGIYEVKKEKIDKVLAKVGLSEAAKTPAGKLSKGMTVRLKLARAFMTDPDVLFLDEPTSGLDPASARAVHRMIVSEKGRGKTVFLTTHTMTEAEKLCDHIAMLNEGKIVECGEPKEICRRYDHQRKLMIHLTDGRDMEIPHTKNSGRIIGDLMSTGSVETVHTSEPDLETVFLELTGKELST